MPLRVCRLVTWGNVLAIAHDWHPDDELPAEQCCAMLQAAGRALLAPPNLNTLAIRGPDTPTVLTPAISLGVASDTSTPKESRVRACTLLKLMSRAAHKCCELKAMNIVCTAQRGSIPDLTAYVPSSLSRPSLTATSTAPPQGSAGSSAAPAAHAEAATCSQPVRLACNCSCMSQLLVF